MDPKLSLERLCIKLESELKTIRECIDLLRPTDYLISRTKDFEKEMEKLPLEHNRLYKVFTEELEKIKMKIFFKESTTINDYQVVGAYYGGSRVRRREDTHMHQEITSALKEIGKFDNF